MVNMYGRVPVALLSSGIWHVFLSATEEFLQTIIDK